ncbi:MAG TPA: selenocysteine-specific translation elongation factor [Longimicrobiales bacterium]|nr:selenocysteine-specific translation elongation factor [Longimicrobiales bacterium]
MRRLILGTAGHIDHGKTRLVHSLTGVDTDRLAEEKRRGITIELGFAPLRLEGVGELGVVDVPGHEGFVRTMVAGATGMDLVLLVVAADEGVMPQTREHLAILELLGVRTGVVALTKRDLVESEWLELVRDDVRGALAATPFADWPLVPVSAATGEGLEELRRALAAAAAGAPERADDDLFRLPVDRAFSVHGTGTVVTGTVWQGSVRPEARLRVLPGGAEARVRAVQVHGADAAGALAGQRAALALTGPGRDTVERGSVLVEGAAWSEQGMLTVRLRVLPDSAWSIAHRQRVRLHLGTREIMGRVALLEGRSLAPGQEAWAQLRLESPAVARVGDRFVLRSYSPVATIAGGEVVEAAPPKRRRLSATEGRALEALRTGDPPAALAARLELDGWAGSALDALPVALSCASRARGQAVAEVRAAGALEAGGRLFADPVAREARGRLERAVEALHAAQPIESGLEREALRRSLPPHAHEALADGVLEALLGEGRLESVGPLVRRPGHQRRLSVGQEALRSSIRARLAAAGLEAVGVGELADGREADAIWPVVRLMEEEGEIVCVAPPEGYLAAAALEAAEGRLRATLPPGTLLDPAGFREVLGLSRKHLIPLLEHFDRSGVTVRAGAGRRLAPPEGS